MSTRIGSAMQSKSIFKVKVLLREEGLAKFRCNLPNCVQAECSPGPTYVAGCTYWRAVASTLRTMAGINSKSWRSQYGVTVLCTRKPLHDYWAVYSWSQGLRVYPSHYGSNLEDWFIVWDRYPQLLKDFWDLIESPQRVKVMPGTWKV